MAEFKRLDPTMPVTNGQIAEAINKTHDCVHQGFEKLGDRLESFSDALNDDRKAWRRELAAIQKALGVKDSHADSRRKLGGLEQWKAWAALFSAAAGAAGFYKYIFPAIEAGLAALHAALMAG